MDAILPDDLERLRHAVDNDADLLAREPAVWGRGYPEPRPELLTPRKASRRWVEAGSAE
jgi:hypothetical protein